jgi:homoserine/homoserine lactone efflux protein
MELTLFLLLSFGLIILPGPNVMVIVTTSLVHGKVRGLQAVAGTSCAMIVQLLVAALGTAWFVTAVSEGLTWLKWFGVLSGLQTNPRVVGSHRNDRSERSRVVSTRVLGILD